MEAPWYVILKADHVDPIIDDLLLRNALPRLYFLIQDLNDSLVTLARLVRQADGLIYVCGGYFVLGTVPHVRSFLSAWRATRNTLPCTFSVGVGRTVRDAELSLERATAHSRRRHTRPSRLSRSSAPGGPQDSPAG